MQLNIYIEPFKISTQRCFMYCLKHSKTLTYLRYNLFINYLYSGVFYKISQLHKMPII